VGHVPAGAAQLYCRDVGDGPPIVVIHGGPDFDHNYLLPELDRLAASFRLIYYDQRGRGRSAERVGPDDVTMRSETDDLETLGRHFGFEAVAVLGHSWGCLVAIEFAIRHPDRVSHLILMNTAPASGEGFRLLRDYLRRIRPPGDVERMAEIASSEAFRRGDVDAEAAYYRIHYAPTERSADLLDQLVGRLRVDVDAAGILLARAIENRLFEQTWLVPGYDLLPALRGLDVPALVLHGEHDFVPVELAADIAAAIPGARLAVLPDCGHFAFLDAPDEVHDQVRRLLDGRM
jgi:proline iminopeptidase